MSYLALCHPKYPCDNAIQALGKEPLVTGWLEGTFGTKCPCVKQLLNAPQSKIVRIHVLNGPCLRNQRCGAYEPFYGETIASVNRKLLQGSSKLTSRIERAFKRTSERLKNALHVTCYVSPCLECDLGVKQRNILADYAKRYLPQCVLVDNPLRGHCLPNAVCEKHGPSPQIRAPCIADLDGIPLEAVSVKSYLAKYAHCDLTYLWSYAFNCIKGVFEDPRKRTCSGVSDYLKKVKL